MPAVSPAAEAWLSCALWLRLTLRQPDHADSFPGHRGLHCRRLRGPDGAARRDFGKGSR
jgi:hypothetical protein